MPYDAVLIHPPAIFDFRARPLFPGPISQTLPQSTSQFIVFPVGLLSMADFLDREGFAVNIVNLGELMVTEGSPDVHALLQGLESRLYAIDLHWIVHAQGAIEIARLCKRYHPDSLVVLGGLSATCFHQEILKTFPHVDGIIRGEGEKAMVQLLSSGDKKALTKVRNLTYRGEGNRVRVNPLTKPCESLDAFDFTRWDLVTPSGLEIALTPRVRANRGAAIPICRGCVFNCVSCGGSKYSYRKLHGRERPAFRSPKRIVEDLKVLGQMGFKNVFLFQDARIGGRKYWKKLLSALREERPVLKRLAFELFTPADEEFVRDLSHLDVDVSLSISPESGAEKVRKFHGRNYGNDELKTTFEYCLKYRIPITVFFMIGLSQESLKTFEQTTSLCEEVCRMNLTQKTGRTLDSRQLLSPNLGPMILLDPGSLGFDFPSRYGYRLVSRTFADYYQRMARPSWHQWISYETRLLSRGELSVLMIRSLESMIDLKEKYGFQIMGGLDRSPADRASCDISRFLLGVNRVITDEVEAILEIADRDEKDRRLRVLQTLLNEWVKEQARRSFVDPYNYREKFEAVMHESVGIMSGG